MGMAELRRVPEILIERFGLYFMIVHSRVIWGNEKTARKQGHFLKYMVK
jgi:hypothetical protein